MKIVTKWILIAVLLFIFVVLIPLNYWFAIGMFAVGGYAIIIACCLELKLMGVSKK